MQSFNINFAVPSKWSELSDKQLRYVYQLIADGNDAIYWNDAREVAVNLLVRILRISFFTLDENMVEIHAKQSGRIWTVPSSCCVSSEGHWVLGWYWIWTHCLTKTCIPCLHGRVPLWHARLCGSSVSGFQVISAGCTRFCWHLLRSHRHRGTRQTWPTLSRPTGNRCR